jgi:hypothetical protein
MPRSRWSVKARRAPLTNVWRRFLLTGEREPGDWETFVAHIAVTHGHFVKLADRWNEHRASLLAKWIDEYPGTRPDAWWWLEAQEPRQLVVAPEMAMGPCVLAEMLWRRERGVPALCVQVRMPEHPDVYVESPPAYLKRLSLLTATEARSLSPEDFEPEPVEYDYIGPMLPGRDSTMPSGATHEEDEDA